MVAGQGPLPPLPILKLLLSMITTPPASIPRDSKEDQDTLHRIAVRFAALVKGEQAEAGAAPAAPPNSFPPEVEDEANAHFQRVYAGAESLEDLMQVMSRWVLPPACQELSPQGSICTDSNEAYQADSLSLLGTGLHLLVLAIVHSCWQQYRSQQEVRTCIVGCGFLASWNELLPQEQMPAELHFFPFDASACWSGCP